MRIFSRLIVVIAIFLVSVPSLASALDFESDFYATDWMLDSGSEATQNASSITLSAAPVSEKERGRITLSAAPVSEKERGRITLRPILATTPAEILSLVFVVEASSVTAPLAARVFYYDNNRNYLGSDPLFGTLNSGTIVAMGTVLNPMANVAGLRVRLYSNAQTGSVTFERLTISGESIPPVPEPGTALLMSLGLLGLAAGTRRVA